jgi:tripartite-type tricarboxylate transporter receptor subunit TctC
MPRNMIAAVLASALAMPTAAAAQSWPTRPLTMMIPFTAGSSIDVAGRILAPRMAELLGQPIVIENQGGSGGMAGAARVAKAPPDGYFFELGGSATHAFNQSLYKAPLYNAATDFTAVALIVDTPAILVTRKDLPVGNFKEFVAYAKANQAKMQYGSAGNGSATHLACVLLNAAMGVNVTHVPYRGGPQVMQDLIAGRIDYYCPLAAGAIPQIEAKTINAIALLSKNRAPSLPALASTGEQGLPNFEANSWYAFFLPKGTPAPIVQRLHDATIAAMETPAVRERLKDIGADVVPPERRSPEYLQKFVVSEIETWGAAIRAAGVSGE